MIFQPLGSGQAVAVLAPGVTTDSYGDPVESWDTPTRHTLRGAFVQDVDSVEAVGDGRTRVVTRKTLYAPGRAPITAGSRVEVDGDVFLVDGEPAVKRNRTRPVYTSAALTRPTG